MKFKRNLLILSAILIGILIVVAGCLPAPTTPPAVGVPSNGTISIASGAVTTNDTTPSLTISATDATHMAFSGNGTTWSSWVAYATAYSTFNITTGAGCTTGDGTKIVYAKYKNDNGESATKVYDSIYLDTAAPTLTSAVYTDVDSSGTVNASDKITFTFNDEMLTSTVTASTVKTVLPLSSSKSFGTSPTVSWDSGLKVCYVTLGTSPTLVVGTTTVTPSSSVKDTAGNAYASTTAVTITGTTTTVLSSVTISRSATSTTAGGSAVTLTATALSTAGTIMTSSCTYIWSITSGPGTISTSTTSTATYTPPSSGTGTAYIKVSAVKTGTTTPVKTATTTVTVTTAVASTDPDPTKLFISGKTGTAKYTALPSGATIKVYSHASNSSADALAAGARCTITLNNEDTTFTGISADHYIFFMITYSDDTTSALTADGRLPSPPDTVALDSIQAINKNEVTSTAAGTVVTGDKITLYVSNTRYSDPTTVGSTMTFTNDLDANNEPYYTRTNAAGHESALSSAADGKILSPTDIGTSDVDDGSTLTVNDTITLTFGENVIVTADILLPHISWVTTNGSSKFGGNDTTALLAGPVSAATTVVLTAFAGCVDIDTDETVKFNILPTIPIVDDAGRNRVLPFAADQTFDSGSF